MQNRNEFVVDKFVVDEFRNLTKKIYDERFRRKVRQTTNNRKLPKEQYANFSILNPELRLIFICENYTKPFLHTNQLM